MVKLTVARLVGLSGQRVTLRLTPSSKAEFFVTQGAGFALQQHRDAVSHGIGQACAARAEFLLVPVKFKWPFGHGANQQFK